MKWYNDIRVGAKISLMVSFMAVCLGIVSFIGYYYSDQAGKKIEIMYEDRLLPVMWLTDNRNQARAIEGDLFALMITTDPAENAALKEDMAKRMEAFDKNLSNYEKTNLTPAERDTVKRLRETFAKVRDERQKVVELALQNKNAEAYALYTQKVKAMNTQAQDEIRQLAEDSRKRAEAMHTEAEVTNAFVHKLLIVVAITAIVIAVLVGRFTARTIAGPVKSATAHVTEMAQNNFTRNVPPSDMEPKDEFGAMARAFQTMATSMRQLIGQIRGMGDQVAAASQQLTSSAEQSAEAANSVAQSSTMLASSVAQQLQAVDEAVHVIEQMATTLEEVAVSATQVSEVAETTASRSDSGKEAVQEAVTQMHSLGEGTAQMSQGIQELKTSSDKIGSIISLISSIAGQTNLLALNAAIEAARAGEQGRGFAVVAEEVRKLAEQSSTAAREITELVNLNNSSINQTVASMETQAGRVQKGIELVNFAGQGFNEINQLIRSLSNQVRDISAAVEELAANADKVVASVREIETGSKASVGEVESVSAATQEQSASMQEIASSSKHLAQLAQNLQREISRFEV